MRRLHCASPGMGAVVSAALILAAAPVSAPRASAQAAAGKDSPALTVSVGPRGGEWKRVFSETRFPSTAGIYEPLLVYNRATGSYLPWLATGYE